MGSFPAISGIFAYFWAIYHAKSMYYNLLLIDQNRPIPPFYVLIYILLPHFSPQISHIWYIFTHFTDKMQRKCRGNENYPSFYIPYLIYLPQNARFLLYIMYRPLIIYNVSIPQEPRAFPSSAHCNNTYILYKISHHYILRSNPKQA